MYLKNISQAISLSLFLLSSVVADTLKPSYNMAYNGDVVFIESCDKAGWCKLKGKVLYIRKHKFTRLSKDMYILNRSKAYYYIKHEGGEYWGEFDKSKKSIVIPKKSKVKPSKSKKQKLKTKHNYFAMTSIGCSVLSIDSTVEASILAPQALDNTAFTYDISVGYKYDKTKFATFNIARTALAGLDVTNFYITANYQWTKGKFNPYIGALAGYSEIVYKKSPVIDTTAKNSKGADYMIGIQAGINQKIKDKLSLITQYQLIKYNHHTSINSEYHLNQEWQNNLSIGVKYDF